MKFRDGAGQLGRMHDEIYQFGPFRIDCKIRTLQRNDDRIPVTGKEFDILRTLVRNAPHPVDNEIIFREAWPAGQLGLTDDNLRPHVRSLRSKLGKTDTLEEYVGNARRRYFLAVPVITITDPAKEPPLAPLSSSRARPPLGWGAAGFVVSIVVVGLALFAAHTNEVVSPRLPPGTGCSPSPRLPVVHRRGIPFRTGLSFLRSARLGIRSLQWRSSVELSLF